MESLLPKNDISLVISTTEERFFNRIFALVIDNIEAKLHSVGSG
jgi:hypothetical protein